MATGVTHDRPATTVLSPSSVRELLVDRRAPCLSLYMPTHRTVPDNRVDVPMYRRLVGSLEAALAPALRRAAIDRLLEPVRAIGDDVHFWRHAREGLAVLAATDFCRVFRLPVRPATVAHVGNRFHTVPLVRLVADSDRFHALVLTSRAATAYEGRLREGDVDALDVVPLGVEAEPGVLRRDDVVDAESREPHRVQRGMGPAGLGAGGVVHGGAGSKRDATATDTEIFLRRVDAVVFEGLSAPAGLPLVLVALPRLAAEFRRLSRNHLLLDEIVPRDVHLAPARDVAADVAAVVGRDRARRIDHDLDRFAAARGRGMAAADLTDIARAAVAGHVGLLLIERDRFEPGILDRATGAITFAAARPAGPARGGASPAGNAEDVIGAIAETVVLHGGTVLAVDRVRMPTESGAAAIYRHP